MVCIIVFEPIDENRYVLRTCAAFRDGSCQQERSEELAWKNDDFLKSAIVTLEKMRRMRHISDTCRETPF